jgi:hypothetical protein
MSESLEKKTGHPLEAPSSMLDSEYRFSIFQFFDIQLCMDVIILPFNTLFSIVLDTVVEVVVGHVLDWNPDSHAGLVGGSAANVSPDGLPISIGPNTHVFHGFRVDAHPDVVCTSVDEIGVPVGFVNMLDIVVSSMAYKDRAVRCFPVI